MAENCVPCANWPATVSAPSLAMMVKVPPAVNPLMNEALRLALPRLTLPCTSSWSYWPVPVPPSSTAKVPPVNVTLPVCRVPALAPGASVPPLTATLPVVPVPPSVPPLFTVVAEVAIDPPTSNVPPLIVVAPV